MTPDELLAELETAGTPFRLHHHPAVFTVAESAAHHAAMPGGHSKNLFLKDRKGRVFLVTAGDDTAIDLKRLHVPLGASGRLSFGSPELLRDLLGVEPGSVTPFGAINDRGGRVEVVLDRTLLRHETVYFHPLVNTMSVGVAPRDLLAFLERCGHPARVLDLPAPADCADGSPDPS